MINHMEFHVPCSISADRLLHCEFLVDTRLARNMHIGPEESSGSSPGGDAQTCLGGQQLEHLANL